MSLKEKIVERLLARQFKEVKVAIDRDSAIHGRPATQVEVVEQVQRVLRTHEFKFAKDLNIPQDAIADLVASFMTKKGHHG